MSSYKLLAMQIAGAALVSVAVVLVAALASFALYNPKPIDRPAFPLLASEMIEQPETAEAAQPEQPVEQPTEQPTEQPEAQPENTAETPPAAGTGLGALLASADLAAGKKLAKKCTACHTVDSGGKNKIGPPLWDIVGRDIGGVEGFRYSGALANMGGAWGYEELDGFIEKPKAFASGTKMSFSGIKSETDRANLIAYLRSLSDKPAPLP